MTDPNDTVTFDNATEMDTGKVSKSGQLFVGKEYGGSEVKYVLRVVDEPETETDESNEANAETA